MWLQQYMKNSSDNFKHYLQQNKRFTLVKAASILFLLVSTVLFVAFVGTGPACRNPSAGRLKSSAARRTTLLSSTMVNGAVESERRGRTHQVRVPLPLDESGRAQWRSCFGEDGFLCCGEEKRTNSFLSDEKRDPSNLFGKLAWVKRG